MSAQHTPTPWVVDEDPLEDKGYKTLITMPGKNGFQGTSLAYVNHNWNDADHGERRISWAEAEANARLIAAAPDMLSVILDMFENPEFQVAIGGNPNRIQGLMDRARAAIAKAKGGAA